MTSQVEKETCYQELGILNNFTSHKYFVKIKPSCSKRRSSGKVNEIEQNDVTNNVISQKRDLLSNKDFAKIFLRSC